MGTGDVSLACVSLLVDELVRGGMRHACVSPGSRSTPIALALGRDPRVTVHVHLDERASAFFALGIAKVTGEPVAVACTSGTAAANFLPAVAEASQARVPLIVLTADRPPRLRDTGANQTIDQTELYGNHVRQYLEAPLPVEGAGTAATWRELGARAAASAADHPPRPVHVNLPFDDPLTPAGEPVSIGSANPITVRRGGVLTVMGPREPGSVEEVTAVADRFIRDFGSARGAIVAGTRPVPGHGAASAAQALGWPLVAEPTSGARHLDPALTAGQALLACDEWIGDHRPDVVLQIGATPTTRATQTLVASAGSLVVLDAYYPDPDPERRASWRIELGPAGVCTMIQQLATGVERSEGWLEDWREADAIARRTIDDVIDGWDEPFEGRIARDLAVTAASAACTLVVGSSMPIRDMDYYMDVRRGQRQAVLANRGASGIDGFVSTVLGVAATGTPTFALCGDLTFLHDAGSLLWSARRGLSAVFVVVNNGGGAIFDFLPQRDLPEHERLFTTPHGLDLAALCLAAGAGYTRIRRADELIPAVERAAKGGDVHVVEVPSDRTLNVRRHAEVQAAVDAALA